MASPRMWIPRMHAHLFALRKKLTRKSKMPEVQYSLRTRAEDLFRKLQNEITSTLEVLDGSGQKFFQDTWERPGGGGGRTRILTDGDVFEKAGVNFSAVHGEAP